MAPQSWTEILRVKLDVAETEALLEKIKAGPNGGGGMWIHMEKLIPDESVYDRDSFGPRYAVTSGPKWSRTDDGWDSMQSAFSRSPVK